MNEEDKKFIVDNLDKNTSKLLFKYDKDPRKRFLINQIGKRQKTKNKLPSFYKDLDFIFPQNSKAIEQCSSELTAKIKNEYFQGKKFIDLTGGLGVDCYYFSKRFNNAIYNELDNDLFKLAQNNFKNSNIEFYNSKAEDLIDKLNEEFDLVYFDPDRRDEQNKKLYLLEDLRPNLFNIINKVKAKDIIVKLSPIFEISEFSKYFEKYNVWIISLDGEVKELLLHLNKDISENKIKIIIAKNEEKKEYNYISETLNINPTNKEYEYLFEPDVAILKANLQDKIAFDNNLSKINKNTQYLFSNSVVKDLPGSFFQIKLKLKYNKKDFSDNNIESGIIKIRNFDDSLNLIKKKLKISESQERYLFFTKDYENRNVCFVCEKLTK